MLLRGQQGVAVLGIRGGRVQDVAWGVRVQGLGLGFRGLRFRVWG